MTIKSQFGTGYARGLLYSKGSSFEIYFVNSGTYERNQLKYSDFVSDDFIAALNEQLKAKTVSYRGNIGNKS
ncbi:hypothetical protein [Candidatus Lariskella endosymbiont of Hedychridium roseum]|uniref:hypothetical protein n=1 Tax=Candidatus Lariskella endosymbiont of Hedychridium roseum TaxID=3077949 RepID=UPI0030D3D84F